MADVYHRGPGGAILAELDSPTPERRALYCRKQSACVGFAASLNWQGFGCDLCRVYEVMTDEEMAYDRDCLIELLRAINETQATYLPSTLRKAT